MDVPKARALSLILFFQLTSLAHSTPPVVDMRYVSYEDIHMSSDTRMFHHANLTSYLHPVFHPSLPYIIISAKNHLIRLHRSNLKLIEVISWHPDPKHKTICKNKGLLPEVCENYIKMLVMQDDGEVIACGTYAHSPMCSWRNVSSLSAILKEESGLGRCPYKRHSNFSFLSTSSGDLYTALTLDAGGFDHAVVRTIGPSVPLRTDKSNSFWLDKPEFAGMFETDEHVYIFFREVAVERISCGKLIVSRVARICKSDRGGTLWILNSNWISFVKATLNCSRAGEYPFYYNEIQDVHFDKDTGVFTALFTTSPNGLHGSAVCEYTMEEIEKAMAGDFKQYYSDQKTWKNEPSQHGKKCPNENDTTTEKEASMKRLQVIQDSQHQLAVSVVQARHIYPLIERPDERYNKIEVEVLPGKYHGKACDFKMVYMTSIEGLVNKFVVVQHKHSTERHNTTGQHHHNTAHQRHHHFPQHQRDHHPHHHPPMNHSREYKQFSCLLESIQLLPPDLPQPINFLKIDQKTKQLVLGTEDRVYQIPRFRCHKYPTEKACEGAQDPHCEWKASKCRASTTPSISSCPATHHLGKIWCTESEWSDCSATCGEGIQMRMKMCLEPTEHPAHINPSTASYNQPGTSYETRPCKKKNCHNHNVSSWSAWLVNENSEERHRCSCQSGEQENVCKAVLEKSERTCKDQSKCGLRSKRLVINAEKKSLISGQKRYKQSTNPIHNSRYSLKTHPMSNTTLKPRDFTLRQNNLKSNYYIRSYTRHNSAKSQRGLQDKNSNYKIPTYLKTKNHVTKATPSVPKETFCPDACLQQLPAYMGIFFGYCGCRDMGRFRVCHKCSS